MGPAPTSRAFYESALFNLKWTSTKISPFSTWVNCLNSYLKDWMVVSSSGGDTLNPTHMEPWSDQSVLCPSQDLWGDILDIEHYQMSAIFWFFVIYNILPHWSYLTEVSARKSYKKYLRQICISRIVIGIGLLNILSSDQSSFFAPKSKIQSLEVLPTLSMYKEMYIRTISQWPWRKLMQRK